MTLRDELQAIDGARMFECEATIVPPRNPSEEESTRTLEEMVRTIREYGPLLGYMKLRVARLDQNISAGTITEEQAKWFKAGMTAAITALVQYAELERFNESADIPRP